jgi:transcriptional regulator with XRE-family HTH domain
MFSAVKTKERELAVRLRRELGMSVREIAVAVGVSRSTSSLWLRDIPLTDEQRESLRGRNPIYNNQCKGALANAEQARARRRAYQDEGRRRARKRRPEYVAGCVLFWTEGSRRQNTVEFTNSDPEMVGVFVNFLRNAFAVENERIRLTCNLFADHEARIREVEDHWLRVAALPRSSLRRSTVNRYSRHSQRKRRNMLPYGTCRVTVHSTEIVQMLYGSIQEFGGFDRPEWLG